MDDLVIGGNDNDVIQKFKGYLNQCFHIKDLGALKNFLGIEVARSLEKNYFSQRKYALDIIAECGLESRWQLRWNKVINSLQKETIIMNI